MTTNIIIPIVIAIIFAGGAAGLVKLPGKQKLIAIFVTQINSTKGYGYQFFDSGNPSGFGWVVCVGREDGVSELGRYIDMHYSGNGDYDYRIELTSTSTIQFGGHVSVKGNVTATGDVTAYSSSDFRLKENIQHIKGGLDTLKRLVPVTFNWNKAALKNHTEWKEGETKAGFIAQDVQKVIPDMVHQNGEYLSLDYNHLFAYMVAAIKDLSDRMDNLEWRMDNE